MAGFAGLGLLFAGALIWLLVQESLHKPLNHDENMYVSGGLLLADGKLPYKDFPYFQMPLQTMAYAPMGLFGSPENALLSVRLLNTACAVLCCVVVFVVVWKVARNVAALWRAVVAVSAVVLLVASPELKYASGLAWNHDLSILLAIAALGLLATNISNGSTCHAQKLRGQASMFVLSGLLLGLAVSTRLSFAILVPFVLLMLVATPADDETPVGRFRQCLLLVGGVVAGLLPAVALLLNDPASFWFGNVTYHQLNERYWADAGLSRLTLHSKFDYIRHIVLRERFDWVLLLGSGAVVVLVALRRRASRPVLAATLVAVAWTALVVAIWIPTPSQRQYLYASYAVLVFAFTLGVVSVLCAKRLKIVASGILCVAVTVSLIGIYDRYSELSGFVGDTTTAQVHNAAREIRDVVDGGTIATLAPIYVLQAGLQIYPSLAPGPFGVRVAPLVPSDERDALRLDTMDDLVSTMQVHPPAAVLVGTERDADELLIAFAKRNGYYPQRISGGLTLWIKPDQP